jgi:hypothetical protein
MQPRPYGVTQYGAPRGQYPMRGPYMQPQGHPVRAQRQMAPSGIPTAYQGIAQQIGAAG